MGTKWQATIKTLIKPTHPPPAGFTGRGLINIHENVKLSMSWLPRSISACKTGRMWNVQKKNVNGGYLFHLPTMSTVGRLFSYTINKNEKGTTELHRSTAIKIERILIGKSWTVYPFQLAPLTLITRLPPLNIWNWSLISRLYMYLESLAGDHTR